MRGELSRLRGVEEEAKNKTNQVSSMMEELERLRKELSTTQQEKKTIEDWAQTYRDEMEKVKHEPRYITAAPGAQLSFYPPPAPLTVLSVFSLPVLSCR